MPPVLVSIENGVLTATLNRPEKLNAFNPEMHTLLREALERATDEPGVRALLLTGAGRGFCAGQDLFDAQLDLERDLQREAGLSEDYREGVSAFMQKRAPKFKGK